MPETAQDILKQINLTPGQVESTKQQLEREICRRDLAYFIDEYVKIEDRDVEGIVIPFRLWDSQANLRRLHQRAITANYESKPIRLNLVDHSLCNLEDDI
ncbi:MAG: hypothetical protein IPJ03_17300 [Ignavibacteriales bacterium]|nr:hypothetical protein [Ignavibacteriales bacterium]